MYTILTILITRRKAGKRGLNFVDLVVPRYTLAGVSDLCVQILRYSCSLIQSARGTSTTVSSLQSLLGLLCTESSIKRYHGLPSRSFLDPSPY